MLREDMSDGVFTNMVREVTVLLKRCHQVGHFGLDLRSQALIYELVEYAYEHNGFSMSIGPEAGRSPIKRLLYESCAALRNYAMAKHAGARMRAPLRRKIRQSSFKALTNCMDVMVGILDELR